MKVYILLALIGVIYCSQESVEVSADDVAYRYEKFGNGVKSPESVDQIREKCRILGNFLRVDSVFYKDLSITINYGLKILLINPKVFYVISTEKPTFLFFNKLRIYCEMSEDKQVTYAQITNSKLIEAKKLRDRFIGYLNEAYTQNKINLTQILCVAHNFFDNVINIHDDQDGFREYARIRTQFYIDMFVRLEEIYKVRPATTCDVLKETYPESQFKSYSMLLSKILLQYGDLFISPEFFAKKALSTLVSSPTELAGLPSNLRQYHVPSKIPFLGKSSMIPLFGIFG